MTGDYPLARHVKRMGGSDRCIHSKTLEVQEEDRSCVGKKELRSKKRRGLVQNMIHIVGMPGRIEKFGQRAEEDRLLRWPT